MRRKPLSKRAISDNLLYSILDMLLAVAVMLSVVFLVKGFIINNIDTSRTESRIFMTRMMYSPNLLAYEEPLTGRVLPYTIDYSRFNQSVFDNSTNQSYFYGTSRFIASRMTLTVESRDAEIFYNKNQYTAWEYFAKARVPGAGSARLFEKRFPVTVYKDGKMMNGMLRFEVVIPNS